MKTFRVFACLGLVWLGLFVWRRSVREEARAARERAAEESVEKAIPDVNYQLEIYDIRDISTSTHFVTSPKIDWKPEWGEEPIPAPPKYPTDQDFVDLIRREIAPNTWDDPEHSMFSIDVSNGKLVVVHTTEVHRQIREYLEEYRARQRPWFH
ncbi:MAG TPA: hypothetical protein VKX17_27650 [Planctomycetota bacterium]|nr:hypothetical protein [Planctomycetota bacterium]